MRAAEGLRVSPVPAGRSTAGWPAVARGSEGESSSWSDPPEPRAHARRRCAESSSPLSYRARISAAVARRGACCWPVVGADWAPACWVVAVSGSAPAPPPGADDALSSTARAGVIFPAIAAAVVVVVATAWEAPLGVVRHARLREAEELLPSSSSSSGSKHAGRCGADLLLLILLPGPPEASGAVCAEAASWAGVETAAVPPG